MTKKEIEALIAPIGNAPLLEPELDSLLLAGDIAGLITTVVSTHGDGKVRDLSAEDGALIVFKVKERVRGFYSNGVLKTTPNTKDFKPLTFIEILTVTDKLDKLNSSIGTDSQSEAFADTDDFLINIIRDQNTVDLSKLTEWEIELLKEGIIASSQKTAKTMMGKS